MILHWLLHQQGCRNVINNSNNNNDNSNSKEENFKKSLETFDSIQSAVKSRSVTLGDKNNG